MNYTDKDRTYLACILDSIHLVSVHLSMLEQDEVWYRHPTVREAILRSMHIMAESCQKLSEQTKMLMPDTNWRAIANFRNVLVHDYAGGIDFTVVGAVMDSNMVELQACAAAAYKQKFGSDYVPLEQMT